MLLGRQAIAGEIIAGESAGSNLDKATSLGAQVLNEEQFDELLAGSS